MRVDARPLLPGERHAAAGHQVVPQRAGHAGDQGRGAPRPSLRPCLRLHGNRRRGERAESVHGGLWHELDLPRRQRANQATRGRQEIASWPVARGPWLALRSKREPRNANHEPRICYSLLMNRSLESILRFINLTTSGLLAGSLGFGEAALVPGWQEELPRDDQPRPLDAIREANYFNAIGPVALATAVTLAVASRGVSPMKRILDA